MVVVAFLWWLACGRGRDRVAIVGQVGFGGAEQPHAELR